jgi:hypothetical protein
MAVIFPSGFGSALAVSVGPQPLLHDAQPPVLLQELDKKSLFIKIFPATDEHRLTRMPLRRCYSVFVRGIF